MSEFLTRLEALDKAATPGPWESNIWETEELGGLVNVSVDPVLYATSVATMERNDHQEWNADLIVHLRNHVPEIIALVKAADEHLRRTAFLMDEAPLDEWDGGSLGYLAGDVLGAQEDLRVALEALDK